MGMTLDKQIEKCIRIAEEQEREAENLEYSKLDWKCEANQCLECASEHRQLAKWLTELKTYEEAREEIRCLPIVWKEDAGVRKCLGILDKHLMEVNADDD